MKSVVFLLSLLSAGKVWANPACAVCTVAIGASLSIARSMGVDDCVVGVVSGAMMAILGYWLIRFFDKKGWDFPARNPILMAASVASIGFVYLGEMTYQPGIIGFLYIDSFLFANLIGAATFILAMKFYEWMKYKNGGHAHFPFEKVVVPVLAVIIMAWIFDAYPVCNCHAVTDDLMDLS